MSKWVDIPAPAFERDLISDFEAYLLPGGEWRLLFDAVPIWMFVVDEDVRILAYNDAAASLIGLDARQAIGRRGGDLLHCIHSPESAEGCGKSPSCQDCMVRCAVAKCYKAGEVTRQRTRLQLFSNAGTSELFVLMTVVPWSIADRNLALLMLEDISVLTDMERIIPICAACRKIRLESSAWEPIEVHFHERLEIQFTHGLCPDCASRYSEMI